MKRITGATLSNEISLLEKENRKLAYRAALEGIVLLENNGVLPLKSKKIYAFGTGVKQTVKGGTGSGEVNERYSVSIYDGLLNKKFEIMSNDWLDLYDGLYNEALSKHKAICKRDILKARSINQMIEVMTTAFENPKVGNITEDHIKDGDLPAVYVVARQAGEALDKKIEKNDLRLSEDEIKDINFLQSKLSNLILVINSGSMMDISALEKEPAAVIYFSEQGEEGGNAFAAILAGEITPSGKLTDTWAKHYSDIPYHDIYSYLSGDTTREEYKEDIYVGYRYFDTFKVTPKYHFGYGLSYTKFDIKYLYVISLIDNKVTLKVEVNNIGEYLGKEVVQIYASLPNGRIEKEAQRLIGFAKTRVLKPGQKEILTLSFDLDYLKSYDQENDASIIEKGKYIIKIGNSSKDNTQAFVINVQDDIIVEKHKNLCNLKENLEVLHQNSVERIENIQNLEIIDLKPSNFVTKVHKYPENSYQGSKKAREIVDTLTTNELIELVVGSGFGATFSKSKIVVPGAVGRLTNKLYKKGVMGLQLSDGPAGLRLMKRAKICTFMTKMGEYFMSFLEYLPDALKSLVLVKPNAKNMLYQYCTAFPVATALAQTWNTKLCEEVGLGISKEMSKYLITYWLAPAMNIHRNPLCGRNFEYMSEDPLLTGKIASALIKGVQSVDGNYVTIKHFVCNNQEDNRNRSNSIVSKRALREIYLRGFEIAVKESDPKALMTSYNLMNGTYTPNDKELLTDILRNEWGYDGIVMTDWNSTDPGLAENHLCITSGNDLIMPGNKRVKKDLKRALKEKKLTVEELRIAARRIVDSTLNSKIYKEYDYKTLTKKQ